MKIGDKVRFLSEVGGGVVTGFQGKDMDSFSLYNRGLCGSLQRAFVYVSPAWTGQVQ